MTRPNVDQRPLVTFAVFAYNQEKYIRDAIEGAFAQTYEPLEIMLSDDCSSDSTFEIMREMASGYRGPHQVRVRQNANNLGLASHINALVNNANGRIVSWAAGDDIAKPDRTKKLVQPMIADPRIVGVHSAIDEIDMDGHFIRRRNLSPSIKNLQLSDVCRNGTSLVTQSHAFSKSVFEVFGDFHPELSNEGPAMAFRELCIGRVAFIDEPLTSYRVGSGTSTYLGQDTVKLQQTEPQKISNWKRTKFKQMLSDSEKFKSGLSTRDINILEKNLRFYTNLWDINHMRSEWMVLIDNFMIKPGDLSSLRAYIRVHMPKKMYRHLFSIFRR